MRSDARLALAARHQREAHGLAQPQREAPARQDQAHAFFGAAGQQADALRRSARLARQYQPVTARRAAADAWDYGFRSCWRLS